MTANSKIGGRTWANWKKEFKVFYDEFFNSDVFKCLTAHEQELFKYFILIEKDKEEIEELGPHSTYHYIIMHFWWENKREPTGNDYESKLRIGLRN